MRKIVIGAFVSLDGVMQAPGGPEEDRTGGFELGGWTAPYFDEVVGAAMGKTFAAPYELLLGRRTYDIFAAHWPAIEENPSLTDPGEVEIAKQFNAITKHVATHRPESLGWKNSRALGKDVVAGVRALKKGDGPQLLVQGSTELIQILLEHDLADELSILTFPVALGRGKRLFGRGSTAAGFKLTESAVSPSGVVIARYVRDGAVKTGSFALESPTPAEIERRKSVQA